MEFAILFANTISMRRKTILAGESRALDVLCVADTCVDLIVSGNVCPQFGQVEQLVGSYDLELGGAANIFASQFVKLGGSADVVGVVGDDVFGDFILKRLNSIGIGGSYLKRRADVKSGLGIALCQSNDRSILTYSGSIDATTRADLTSELIVVARHWHVASYFLLTQLRDYWPHWLSQLRAAGMTVSLDTNWDPEGKWEGVCELLPLVDVFLPNASEACAITGRADAAEAARELTRYFSGLVVVKCGEHGAIAALADGFFLKIPARATPLLIDSIGAGDSFDAGFLRGWLLGWPLEKCLHLATRCGAANLSATGGFNGQLVEQIMEESHDSLCLS